MHLAIPVVLPQPYVGHYLIPEVGLLKFYHCTETGDLLMPGTTPVDQRLYLVTIHVYVNCLHNREEQTINKILR